MEQKLIGIFLVAFYSLSNALFLETKTLKLRDQEVCRDDIERYCPDEKASNILLLNCLQDNIPDDRELSFECQNLIWNIKWNVTRGEGSYVPMKNYALCSSDLGNIFQCEQEKINKGPYVACLIEKISHVKSPTCLNFLNVLQPIIFSDFRLIYHLADVCKEDIEKYKCGRSKNHLMKKQGSTIDCLSSQLDDLVSECKAEVLTVVEQQGADWKFDRALFKACRVDKVTFCSSQAPLNDGQVYNCLVAHKDNPAMSQQCREKLQGLQRIQMQDVKSNYRFFHTCFSDIKSLKCFHKPGQDEPTDPKEAHNIRLTSVLTCLEEARVKGKRLQGDCIKEMTQVRTQMMQDPHINAELMTVCKSEISTCENTREVASLHQQGLLSSSSHRLVIHCLMDLTRHTLMQNQSTYAVSKQCFFTLKKLLKHVGLLDHLDIDPALKYDCARSINKYCNLPQDSKLLMGCLMDLLGAQKVDRECSNRLHEIQFFMARDFKLSTFFWGTCEADIGRLCTKESLGTVLDNSVDDDSNKRTVAQAHILSCLYRNFDNSVSQECSKQVLLLLEQRAMNADLPPELQTVCIGDLARLCKHQDRDNEMACLEENYDQLSVSCQNEVNLAVDAEEDIPLSTRLFLDSCESFWHQHCELKELNENKRKSLIEGMSTDKSEDTDNEAVALMECLISNKNHPDMPKKCRVGVEHHQLVALKHFNTNSHFKKACRQDMRQHCDQHTDKASAIKCLSEVVYNNTMFDMTHQINKKCRKLLTFEVLQMKESVNLDDDMKTACLHDRERFCAAVKPGKGAVMRCLRQHQHDLSDQCRKFVFHREEEEVADPNVDFSLMSTCKHMIKEHCEASSDLFACLKARRNDDDFDQECRRVIVARMRLRAKDIRLNPTLLKDCEEDIERQCGEQMKEALRKPFEAEGLVIFCLRKAYVHKINHRHMSESCVSHITTLLREANLDDLQDAALVSHCSAALKEKCLREVEVDKQGFGGTRAVECLKKHMLGDEKFRTQHTQCFNEIIQRMSESKTDIHVDVMLHRLCSLDASTACKGVVSGEGRVMSCLLTVLNKHPKALSEPCRSALDERVELWNKAVMLAPPQNMAELVSHIQSSPARNFFEVILFSLVILIFCGGLLCGRVTKRISRQAKSK